MNIIKCLKINYQKNFRGFASVINQLVLNCIMVEKKQIEPFYIIWTSPLYQDKEDYNLFDKIIYQPYYSPLSINGKKIILEEEKFITGIITPKKNGILYLPAIRDRKYISSILRKKIIFKPYLYKQVDKFYSKLCKKGVIGVHIRGSGHLDGGDLLFKKNVKLTNGIPLEEYTKKIDEVLAKTKIQQIILFTDNEYTINYMKNIYRDKIYFTNSKRSKGSKGEIHMNNNSNKFKLLEDICIDILLMCKVTHLIHGISNIINFVLCYNPTIQNYPVHSQKNMGK